MNELRHAIRTCPTGYIHILVSRIARKQHIRLLPSAPAWLPDSVAIRLTDTYRYRPSVQGTLVYQRLGNVMTATYAYAGAGTSALASRVASLLAKRLKRASMLMRASGASG
jgi:hypothetical protein